MKKQQGDIAPASENTDKSQDAPTTEDRYIIQSKFKPAVSFKSDYKLIVLISSKTF